MERSATAHSRASAGPRGSPDGRTEAPFGSWGSTIPIETLVEAVIRLGDARFDGEPINTIVGVPIGGGRGGEQDVLVRGADFYSAPRLSPNGRQLAWLSWNHPNMPWNGMDLWLAGVRDDGMLGPARHVAGSPTNWT